MRPKEYRAVGNPELLEVKPIDLHDVAHFEDHLIRKHLTQLNEGLIAPKRHPRITRSRIEVERWSKRVQEQTLGDGTRKHRRIARRDKAPNSSHEADRLPIIPRTLVRPPEHHAPLNIRRVFEHLPLLVFGVVVVRPGLGLVGGSRKFVSVLEDLDEIRET